jgi:hypothetical protein
VAPSRIWKRLVLSNEQQNIGLDVIIFEGDTVFRTFKRVPEEAHPETGEIFNAGIMDSAYATVTNAQVLLGQFDPATSTGIEVLRHTDKYESKHTSHVENGAMVPDSFNVEYTMVVVGVPPQQVRVTFAGPLLEGTGIFAGATGVVTGHARRVNSPDTAVASAFEGKVGGEIRLAHHYHSD